jgi:hypothetical protein
MRYEIKIDIKETTDKYVDGLILGLVRAGYDVYQSWEDSRICFTANDDDVEEVKEVNE